MLLDRTVSQKLLISLIPLRKTLVTHPRRRLHSLYGLIRLHEEERPKLTSKESSGMKRLKRLFFSTIERLTNIYKGREIWIQWAQTTRDP